MKEIITKSKVFTFIHTSIRKLRINCRIAEKKLTALFTGPKKRQAITCSVIAGISFILLLSLFIRSLLPEEPLKPVIHTISEAAEYTTFPETTSTDAETTETVTVPETTTQETTTIEEITTEPETTIPTIIPITDLNISDKDLSTNKEILNKQQANKGPALSSPLGDITASSTDISPVIGFTTGIDVSKYQGNINWNKVKNDGISFAFIKVAGRGYESGTLYYDANYEKNLREAAAAGLDVGAYFFSQATTVEEAREEASLMIDALKNYKITYPVVFDWETAPGYRTYSGISKKTMTAMANTFCDMLEAAGYTAMVYANTFDFERFDAGTLTANYASWLARYPENYTENGVRYQAGDGLAPLDHPYQIWQYSCTGRVAGITGDVDMNVSFIDFANKEHTPMYFDIPASAYQTSVGQTIDITKDVKCYNCAGFNSTASMKYKITDTTGTKINLENAVKHAGVYTITYSLTDFTGYTESVSIPLYVTSQPAIKLISDQLLISPDATLEELEQYLRANIVSAVDGLGNDSLASVKILYPENYYEEISVPIQEETTSALEPETETNQDEIIEPTSEFISETTSSLETSSETESPSEEASSNEATTEKTSTEEDTTMEIITIKRLITGNYTITYELTDSFGGFISIDVTLVIQFTEELPSETSEGNSSSF